jgi:MFS family permease
VISDSWQKLRLLNREAWVAIVTSAVTTGMFYGGFWTVLRNIFVLRMGYGPEVVGMLSAVGFVSYALAALPAGALAMAIGLRRAVLVGVGGMMLCGLAYAEADLIAAAWRQPFILAASIGFGVAFANISVNTAPLLAGATRVEERPHGFAFFICFMSVGSFLGSLLSGALPGLFAGLTGLELTHARPYGYSLAAGALLMAPVIWLVVRMPEQRSARMETLALRRAAPYLLLGVIGLIGLLRLAGEMTVRTFYPVYLDQALAVGTAQIGASMAIGNLLAVPAPLLMPLFVQRLGNLRALVLGVLGLAAGIAWVGAAGQWWMVSTAFVLMTAIAAIARAAWSLFTQEIVAPEWRPMSSAVNNLGIGVGSGALSATGGYLAAGLGYGPLFGLSAASVALGGLTTWLYFGVRRKAVAEPAGEAA